MICMSPASPGRSPGQRKRWSALYLALIQSLFVQVSNFGRGIDEMEGFLVFACFSILSLHRGGTTVTAPEPPSMDDDKAIAVFLEWCDEMGYDNLTRFGMADEEDILTLTKTLSTGQVDRVLLLLRASAPAEWSARCSACAAVFDSSFRGKNFLCTACRQDRGRDQTTAGLTHQSLVQGQKLEASRVVPQASHPTVAATAPVCLQLVQEIPFLHSAPSGRMDHFTVDTDRKWLFVAGLGENSVLVVDAFAGRELFSILCGKVRTRNEEGKTVVRPIEFNRPQGVLYVQASKRLYVANAGSGNVTVLDMSSPYLQHCGTFDKITARRNPDWVFRSPRENILAGLGVEGEEEEEGAKSKGAQEVVWSISFGEEADNLRFADGKVFVGYGEGAIGVIDDLPLAGPVRNADLPLPCAGPSRANHHPESFQIEQGRGGGGGGSVGTGTRIFVNVADERRVVVLDRKSPGSRVTSWDLPDDLSDNFPMCLDEAAGNLYVGVRKPAAQSCVLVFDIDSGSIKARVACAGDMDDLCFDALRRRGYVISGTGAVTVIGAAGAGLKGAEDQFCRLADVPTAVGARTGFWYPERDALYVAVPASSSLPARLLVFQGH